MLYSVNLGIKRIFLLVRRLENQLLTWLFIKNKSLAFFSRRRGWMFFGLTMFSGAAVMMTNRLITPSVTHCQAVITTITKIEEPDKNIYRSVYESLKQYTAKCFYIPTLCFVYRHLKVERNFFSHLVETTTKL